MKRVCIYGATSAIAIEAARCWAERGAALFLVGRDKERLDAVAADLKVRGAHKALTRAMDFDDFSDHEPSWRDARAALNDVDIVLIAHGMLGDQDEAEADYTHAEQILRVNFLSVVSLLTPIANDMEQAGDGNIAVITSVAGDRGRQSNYVYGTAKGALHVFLQGLRNRLFSKGVNVLTVKPGFVATPMTAHLDQGPLFATPEKVGRGLVDAVERRVDEVYLPGFWKGVMTGIKSIPEGVFKRLSL